MLHNRHNQYHNNHIRLQVSLRLCVRFSCDSNVGKERLDKNEKKKNVAKESYVKVTYRRSWFRLKSFITLIALDFLLFDGYRSIVPHCVWLTTIEIIFVFELFVTFSTFGRCLFIRQKSYKHRKLNCLSSAFIHISVIELTWFRWSLAWLLMCVCSVVASRKPLPHSLHWFPLVCIKIKILNSQFEILRSFPPPHFFDSHVFLAYAFSRFS